MGLLAISVVLAYLVIRIVQTREGANPVSFALLFAAELMSLIATVLHFYEAWTIPEGEQPEPLEGTTDVVIATYDEPMTVLEPTIIGSQRVHGVRQVWVLDDGRRDEVREYCEEVGARYVTRPDNAHAKAGNINNALPLMDSEYVLLLDADHVPARDILTKLSGYFRDPRVALVQSPHNFRNLDSVQHRSRTRHEQSLFFQVLMPARDRNEASFWCGSSALLRLSALNEIGGVATETVSEDLHTTTRLQQRGYRARYHNEVLATGLAPHTMADFLLQRYRWAQGTMQVLLSAESPLFGKGWRIRQRLHYVNNLIYYFLPFQRLVYALVLVLVLLLGWLPVGSATVPFLVLLGASVVLTNLASVGFARGMRDAGEGITYTWLTAETHMRAVVLTLLGRHVPFKVTPKSVNALELSDKLRLLRLPLVVIAIVIGSWLLRTWQEAGGTLPLGIVLPGELDDIAYWAATAFVALEVVTVLPSVVRELARTQSRALWRFSVHLDATANGVDVAVTDIHEGGVSMTGPHGLAEAGDDVPIVIAPVAGSDLPPVEGALRVRRVIGHGEHTVYSGTVQWGGDEDRRGVIALCYADLAHEQG
jgi:cellulose synthase (UDP-forming)